VYNDALDSGRINEINDILRPRSGNPSRKLFMQANTFNELTGPEFAGKNQEELVQMFKDRQAAARKGTSPPVQTAASGEVTEAPAPTLTAGEIVQPGAAGEAVPPEKAPAPAAAAPEAGGEDTIISPLANPETLIGKRETNMYSSEFPRQR